MDSPPQTQSSVRRSKGGRRFARPIWRGVWLIGGLFFILAATLLTWGTGWIPAVGQAPGNRASATPAATTAAAPASTATASATPAQTADPTTIPASLPVNRDDLPDGVIVVALRIGKYSHLHIFHPNVLPLTRLTFGEWDDIDPAISPDGSQVAFASNRSGYWDLYSLDLASGQVRQLTETDEYEGHPSWSPDGKFIVYEGYLQDNLDLFLLPVFPIGAPIQLTNDPAADYSPSWSPLGRRIAFVSTRSGEAEIWAADLQRPDDRFENLSRNPQGLEAYPSWSPEDAALAWASVQDGLHLIRIMEIPAGSGPRLRNLGSGDRPVWHPDGSLILTTLETPQQSHLTAYRQAPFGQIAVPLLPLPGQVEGLSWSHAATGDPLPEPIATAAAATPEVLWRAVLGSDAEIPSGRQNVIELNGVEAPDPRLHDIADEAFLALRQRIRDVAGWDFLASLENAYVPLTHPLPPGMGNDWLYTGRAFAFNTAPVSAGWVRVVREDYGQQTYWRTFLLARFQDGTMGRPMSAQAWDLNARFEGDPFVYEAGGALETSPPPGYWIDFTALARAYGFEREPALLTWRTYFPGARFNEYVFRMGLDWYTAMLELYPQEVLITPSPITPVTPSITPTRTPTASTTPVPSRTPSPTPTAIRTPTATDSPIAATSPTP